MTDNHENATDKIDGWTRTYMERQAQGSDADSLLSRIRTDFLNPTSAEPEPERRRPVSRRFWKWLVAAGLLMATLFGSRFLGPFPANAAGLLADVRTVHFANIDRCYRVQFTPDPRYWDRTKPLDGPSESLLWTRGDRFYSDCTIGELRLTIGRDAQGVLWISPTRKKGIRFPHSPLPEPIATLCTINAMTVPALVDDVLADFDLSIRGSETSIIHVHAALKPGRTHAFLSTADLEIDTAMNVLVGLRLEMIREGKPHGTVTFTLVDSAVQNDQLYELAAHLDPDATVELSKGNNAKPTER